MALRLKDQKVGGEKNNIFIPPAAIAALAAERGRKAKHQNRYQDYSQQREQQKQETAPQRHRQQPLGNLGKAKPGRGAYQSTQEPSIICQPHSIGASGDKTQPVLGKAGPPILNLQSFNEFSSLGQHAGFDSINERHSSLGNPKKGVASRARQQHTLDFKNQQALESYLGISRHNKAGFDSILPQRTRPNTNVDLLPLLDESERKAGKEPKHAGKRQAGDKCVGIKFEKLGLPGAMGAAGFTATTNSHQASVNATKRSNRIPDWVFKELQEQKQVEAIHTVLSGSPVSTPQPSAVFHRGSLRSNNAGLGRNGTKKLGRTSQDSKLKSDAQHSHDAKLELPESTRLAHARARTQLSQHETSELKPALLRRSENQKLPKKPKRRVPPVDREQVLNSCQGSCRTQETLPAAVADFNLFPPRATDEDEPKLPAVHKTGHAAKKPTGALEQRGKTVMQNFLGGQMPAQRTNSSSLVMQAISRADENLLTALNPTEKQQEGKLNLTQDKGQGQDKSKKLPEMLSRHMRGSRDSSVSMMSEQQLSRVGSHSRSNSGGKEMVLNFLASKRKSHLRQQAVLSSRQSGDFIERPYTEMQQYNSSALKNTLGQDGKGKTMLPEMTPTIVTKQKINTMPSGANIAPIADEQPYTCVGSAAMSVTSGEYSVTCRKQTNLLQAKGNQAIMIDRLPANAQRAASQAVTIEESDSSVSMAEDGVVGVGGATARGVDGADGVIKVIQEEPNADNNQMIVTEHQAYEGAAKQSNLSRTAKSLNALKTSQSRRELSSGAMTIDESATALLTSVLDAIPTAVDSVQENERAAPQNKLNIIVSDANQITTPNMVQPASNSMNDTKKRMGLQQQQKQLEACRNDGETVNSRQSLAAHGHKKQLSSPGRAKAQALIDRKQIQLQAALQLQQNQPARFQPASRKMSRDSSVNPSSRNSARRNKRSKNYQKQRHASRQGYLTRTNPSGMVAQPEQHLTNADGTAGNSPRQLSSDLPQKEQLNREGNVKSAMSTIGLNMKTEADLSDAGALEGNYGHKDMFQTHDQSRQSHTQNGDPKSVRRRSHAVEEISSPLGGSKRFSKKYHPQVKQTVNSAHFNVEDQELLLAQALQQHRLSQHQHVLLAQDIKADQTGSEMQHRRSMEQPTQEFVDSQQLQRMVLRTQGSNAVSRVKKKSSTEQPKTLHQNNPSHTSSKKASSNPSTWLPQTQQFIQELIQSQHGWSPKKNQTSNFLGPSQLLSTHQRRKPFQLKNKAVNAGNAATNTVIQAPRDSAISRFHNEAGGSGDNSQQNSALSQAQPFNVLQTAANQCFSNNNPAQGAGQVPPLIPPQNPQPQMKNNLTTLENYDNILIKGVRKGLQPQIGRNQIIDALYQIPTANSDEVSSMCSLPKRAVDMFQTDGAANRPMMMRTSTGFHIQQRQSMESTQQPSQPQPILAQGGVVSSGLKKPQMGSSKRSKNAVLCTSMMNQTNSSQIQGYLMQHGAADYQQIVDPSSYITVPKNFQSASKDLKETKSGSKGPKQSIAQPYANEISIAHQQLRNHSYDKRISQKVIQSKKQAAELTGKHEERLLSQFNKHYQEQDRFAERIMQEESYAMQEYHQLLQREIERLRLIQTGSQLPPNRKQVQTNFPGQGLSGHSNHPLFKHAIKQNVQGQPIMSIMGYDQQRIAQNFCTSCHGVSITDKKKLTQFAEDYLGCQCIRENTDSNLRSVASSKETSPVNSVNNMPAEFHTFSDVTGFVDKKPSSQNQHHYLNPIYDQDKVKVQNGAAVESFSSPHGALETPELSRLDQLKLMQMNLLYSQPRGTKKASINMALQGPVLASYGGSRRQKATISNDDSMHNTLQQNSISQGRKDGADLAHLKTVIKKQVIKFYQNNLVHDGTYMRQKGIECKGQTIGGMMMSQPLGCALQEARKLQALEDRGKRGNVIGRTAVANINFQPMQIQGSPNNHMLVTKLPNELTLMALNDRKLRGKAKSSNMLQVQGNLARNVRQRASIELDYELSDHRRVPQSDVNLFFQQINEFVRVTLKFKETITQAHLAQIRRLGRQIGLKFGNVKELDAKFINSKDFVAILKSKIYCMLNAVVMRAASEKAAAQQTIGGQEQSAQKEHDMQQVAKTYKFYVEPSGNNHMIVRSVIKRRSWYNSQELSQEHGWSGQGPKMLNLIWTQVRRPRILRELQPYQIYNHIDGINEIAQKSLLFLNMRTYYQSKGLNVFDYMPETYLIPSTANFELHPQFKEFRTACQQGKSQGQLWIFKPGESTNRGHGIRVFNDYDKVKTHMQEFCRHAENRRGQGRNRNCILQRYIMRPLLISKRKFDIRVFALIVCHADTGLIRGYFYEEGYLRTSSREFSIDKWDNRLIHLTNDAVQKNSSDYGKYESANKISYQDFDKHLLKEKNVSFLTTIVPKIKDMVTDVLEASGRSLYRPDQSHEGVSRSAGAANYNAFELLGFDFMLENDLKLNLIEVNTNPCLDTPCMLLQRIIPTVLDQTLKIAVDPFLQANEHQYYMTQDLTVSEMKFQLVYQDSIELAMRDQRLANESKLEQQQNVQSQRQPGVSDEQLSPLKTASNLMSVSSLTPAQAKETDLVVRDEAESEVFGTHLPTSNDPATLVVGENEYEDDENDSFLHHQSTESPIKIQPNPNEPE